jgi:vancomycin permeability regulator SanA
MRATGRRALVVGAAALVVGLAIPVLWVQAVGQTRVTPALDAVAPVDAVVVLGAGLRDDGTPSIYLQRRLALAAALYDQGAAPIVILSGDAHEQPDGTVYDEPASMRDWITGLGVPEAAVILDREGFDTTATCRRAHDVYGVRSAVVVTQDYHLRRALFACTRAELDAVGVGASATSATPSHWLWWHVRELPASWKAAARELAGR